MAALSHPPPALQVTNVEDDMEISSDIGRLDNDFDIDIDLTAEHDANQDGDYMLEDARSEAGRSVQDQEMNQDECESYDALEHMEDTILLDEELGDAGFQGQTAPAPNLNTTTQSIASHGDEEVVVLHEEASDPATVPQELSQLPEAANSEHEPSLQNVEVQTSTNEDQPSQEQAADRAFAQYHNQSYDHNDEESHEINQNEHAAATTDVISDSEAPYLENPTLLEEANEELEQQPDNTNFQKEEQPEKLEEPTAASGEGQITHPNDEHSVVQAENSQQESSSHPVIVIYEDNEISLFRPKDEDESGTFFLQDAALASQPLSSLLMACREVLGDTIHDEQELQIEIAELDLTIGEVSSPSHSSNHAANRRQQESAHAGVTSFSELLDVYMDLHRLDGTNEPDPMYVTLTTKSRFSARLGSLREAIADGRGFSQLWYSDNGEEEERFTGNDYDESGQDGHQHPTTSNEGSGDGAVQTHDILENATSLPHEELQHDEAPGEVDQQAESNLPGHDTEKAEREAPFRHGEEQHTTQQIEQAHEASAAEVHEPDAANEVPGQEAAEYEGVEEQEQLFDYEDEEQREEHQETGSTGSSTIVGDGSTAQDESKTAQGDTQTEHGDSSHDHGIEDEATADLFEDIEGNIQNTEAHGDTETFDSLEHEIGHGEEAYPGNEEYGGEGVGAFDNFVSTGTDSEDLIDWEEGLANEHGSEHDHTADVAAPAEMEQSFDQSAENWDELLENDEQRQQQEDFEWADNEPTLTAQADFAASTDTLVGGAEAQINDLTGPEEPNTATDIYDEITFDEDEEEGEIGEDHDQSRHPSQSPPGKRSWTEHLEGGDDEDGSDQGNISSRVVSAHQAYVGIGPKRLRSS